MSRRAVLAAGILVALAAPAAPARAAAPKVPPELEADPPVLRLEAGGPTAPMYALAFGPDGRTLYVAGFDKVVRTWRLGADGRWDLQDTAYRIPIGPGTAGVINCLAVSPDNKWLAVGGVGVVEGESGYADTYLGRMFRIRPRQVETDIGAIFLFPIGAPGGNPPAVRRLVGHRGPVVALAFASAPDGGGPVLISAGHEPGAASATSQGRVIAWQVPRGTQLGTWTAGELDPAQKPPALAVRRTGKGAKDVRVAIAWDDGRLRLWDVGDSEPQAFPDGGRLGNSTAIYTSATNLVTGGFGKDRGYLHFWADGAGQGLKTVAIAPFQVDGYDYLLPLGLAAVPTPAGRSDHLAVLLRSQPQDSPRAVYQLGLVSLADRQLVRKAPVPLWPQASTRPVLAASPDGRYVAVAGADQPTVRVYAVSDLVAGRPDHQTLKSVGVPVRRVAFVKKEGARLPGLFLGLSSPPGPRGPVRMAKDDLVFDFVNRDLTRDPATQGWEVRGAAEDGWTVAGFKRQDPAGPWLIDWRRPQGPQVQSAVRLDVAEDVTAVAVVPPIKDVTPAPLLAVATWAPEKGEPLLALYDTRADSPEAPLVQVRQLKGHVQPVRSLAVTRDGRVLASAADDQTVSLWSLADLADIIGQHGALFDIDLVDKKGSVVIEHVDPRSPSSKVLLADDVIKDLAFEKGANNPLAPATGYAFCDELWKVKPGRPIWLTVRREENGKAKDVTVALKTGQAVDNRKPLLSLFLARLGGPEPDWIAWTPTGPYDASGKKIEDYVGWHFNPKAGGGPTTFAELKVYRGNFYEPKLLEPLLTHGSVRGALQEINRPPAPKVEFVAPRPRDGAAGPVLVREPSVPLAVMVDGPSIEKGQVGSVVLEVDGRKEELDLAAAEGQRLSKDVLLRQPGEHTVRVTVRTIDDQSAQQELHLFYQPWQPTIDLKALPKKQTTVGDLRYTLRATVAWRPPVSGVKVSLVRLNGKEETPLEFAPGEVTQDVNKGLLHIQKELDLKRGENSFRLSAVNKGALDKHEAAETAPETFVIISEKQETPRVAFTAVELGRGTDNPRRLAVDPGKPLVVDRPTLHLLGGVTSPMAELSEVHLRGGEPVALEPKGKTFELDKKVGPLEPGKEYKFTLTAKTPRSDEGTAALVIQYRPAPPALQLVAPRAGETFTEGANRAGPPAVEIKGALTPSAEFHAFEVAIRVLNGKDTVPQGQNNGQEIVRRFAEEADAGKGEPVALGKVRLRRGINRIQVRVSNDWGEGPPLEQSVSFLRPPFIAGAKATLEDRKLRVHAQVNAPAEAPLDRVVVHGQKYLPGDLAAPAPAGNPQILTWAVDKVIEYPQGEKTITLTAVSADGRAEATLDVPELPVLLPDDLKVEVRGPEQVRVPSCRLHVAVRSLTRLKQLRLFQDGQPVADVPVEKQRQDDTLTFWEFEDDLLVKGLKPGVNPLRVEAVNQDTKQGADHSVTYVVPQVTLLLDKPKGPQPATYFLKGEVLCGDEGQVKQVEENLKHLRVTVNGFRQRPPSPPQAVLDEPGKHVRSFSVELRLNAPKNTVQIEAPAGLPLKEPSFEVECASPEKPGRLHLLIVNAGKKSIPEQVLVREALAALQLHSPGLHSDVFSEVIPYPSSTSPNSPREILPLIGYAADRYSVMFYLNAIKETIRKDGSPSDVALIYWLGEEVADENGEWYLKTSDTLRNPKDKLSKTGVRLKDLVSVDDVQVGGARVVLLDVVSEQRSGGPRRFDWTRSDAAILRYAWSEGVTVPHLLKALEDAGKNPSQRRVTLEAVAHTAEAIQAAKRLPLLELVANLSGLGQVILAGKPSASAP